MGSFEKNSWLDVRTMQSHILRPYRQSDYQDVEVN